MKNKTLNIATLTASLIALSCTSLAASSNHNSNNYVVLASNNEVGAIKDMLSDSKITLAIKKKFIEDSRINSLHIRVVTVNGKVILTGRVPNQEAKDIAVSLASSAAGVHEVVSNFETTEESLISRASSDTIIATEIKLRLLDDNSINASNIGVKSLNGHVVLTGRVPDEKTKQRVISLAKGTKSVKDVTSTIEIIGNNFIKNISSDGAITTLVSLKLLEDPDLSKWDIHVETINGDVILSGIVPDQALKERAIAIAKTTNEVKLVISRLEVQ